MIEINLYNCTLAYLFVGLSMMFLLIQLSKKDEADYADVMDNLGDVFNHVVIGWVFLAIKWFVDLSFWRSSLFVRNK